MKFNVLVDPWIPVRTREGEIRELGILDVLRDAAQYVEITSPYPNWEFGIYRFLFTFLMDAYRPENSEDIEEISEDGSFDEQVIQDYVDRCEKEGVSFDLFDRERPFLQEPLSSWEFKKGMKSMSGVLGLTPAQRQGNNPVHFEHRFEDEIALSLPDAARALCSLSPFTISGGAGYPPSVNGARTPVYSMVRGDNLFQTLVWGMVPVDDAEGQNYFLPYWRCTGMVKSKEEVAKVSLLFGLTFPARKVTFLDHTNHDVVSMMKKVQPKLDFVDLAEDQVAFTMWAPGLKFAGKEGWKDPYVTYYYDRDIRKSLLPNVHRDLWRDIGSVFTPDQNNAAQVLSQYCHLSDRSYVSLNLYSFLGDGRAKVFDASRNSFRLSEDIVRSEVRLSAMNAGLSAVERTGKKLWGKLSALRAALGRNRKSGYLVQEAEQAEQLFYAECRGLFFRWLLPELQVQKPDYGQTQEEWERQLASVGRNCYENSVRRMNLDAEGLMKAMKIQLNGNYSTGRKEMANSRDRNEEEQEFFRQVDELDEHSRILLRRSCGKTLEDSGADAMRAFYQALPRSVKKYEEEKWFLAACVHCLWDRGAAGEPMAQAVAELMKTSEGGTAGLQKRFVTMLDTSWEDDGFLAGKIARMVRLLRTRGFVVDAQDLLQALQRWDYDSRSVQRDWVKTFERTLQRAEDAQEGDENVD